jgi:purine catabolism regulator
MTMHITIKDILQFFPDKLISLTSGSAGLDNLVSSVNIMDAPDIWNWVKPGDLILTTAYTIKDDPLLQERLIRELAASGCAGLGIKTKRFLPEIPKIMKEVAKELNFPILELPLNLSLAEITNPIISSIAARQSYLLRRSNEIHKTLTTVAIKGGGLHSIITCLGQLTHCPVGCYNTHGSPLSHWLPENIAGISAQAFSQLTHLLTEKAPSNDHSQENLLQSKAPYTKSLLIENHEFFITSFAIMSSNEFFGHISIFQPTNTFLDLNEMALEHTCTVTALDFLKQKAVAESHRLYSRDMLEHILFGDLSNQNTTAIISNFKLMQGNYFECLIIELDQNDQDINIAVASTRLYQATQQIITAKYPFSLISEQAGKVIALIASTRPLKDQEPELYSKLHTTFKEIFNNLKISIGVGSLASDINSVRQSYYNALSCLNLGRTIKGNGHITYPQEVASYALLANSDTSSMLIYVCSSIFLKLETADQGTELLSTLEKYLECDKVLTDTAKELYIHRNTLTNRLGRIVDIANLDFNNRELLFSLRLAFRQKKLKNKMGLSHYF